MSFLEFRYVCFVVNPRMSKAREIFIKSEDYCRIYRH